MFNNRSININNHIPLTAANTGIFISYTLPGVFIRYGSP